MFDISRYRPTHLESAVVSFYKHNCIRDPQDIDLDIFSYDAGIWVHYLDRPSTNYHFRGASYTVVVDRRLPWYQQRVEFAHELGHVLLHAGRQEFMKDDLRAAQEFEANRFAMYALAPTFMIANCLVQAASRQQLVSQLAYAFDVPDTFMDARLKLLQERMLAVAVEDQVAVRIAEDRSSYDYSYRHPLDESIEYLVKDGHVTGTRRRARL